MFMTVTLGKKVVQFYISEMSNPHLDIYKSLAEKTGFEVIGHSQAIK